MLRARSGVAVVVASGWPPKSKPHGILVPCPPKNLNDASDVVNRRPDYRVSTMEKGRFYLIEEDLTVMWEWDPKIEQYLALFANFDEWCKQTSEPDE